ncbi:MAG: putative rane protein [Holophagaceae bacterium]|nr:putative rane protein [Holophagaceae bacterium]
MDNLTLGLAALRTNRLRTLLSSLGVIIGVGSLLAILNLGDSLERYSRDQINQTTALGLIEVTSRTAEQVEGIAIATSDPVRFSEADRQDLGSRFGPAARVALFHQGSGWLSAPGAARFPALITMASPEVQEVFPERVRAGRHFTAADLAQDPAVAVVSHRTAERIAGAGRAAEAVGRVLDVGGYPHRVLGVLEPAHGERATRILLPTLSPFAQARLREHPAPPHLLVRLQRPEDFGEARETVEAWTKARFPGRAQELSVSNPTLRHEQVRRGMLIFKTIMGCIAGISLVVGGIGIMNVLLSSVTERTREIGIRRAVGARRGDVLAQFLSESLAISGIGGLTGIAVGHLASLGGMVLVRAITGTDVRTTTTAGSILLAFGAAFAVGLLFGLYPAWRAAGLSPTEAIRQE